MTKTALRHALSEECCVWCTQAKPYPTPHEFVEAEQVRIALARGHRSPIRRVDTGEIVAPMGSVPAPGWEMGDDGLIWPVEAPEGDEARRLLA